MKIISKIIAWILSIIFVFIALNLIVWLIKYGGISNYSDFLNKKDRNTTISQISIKDPKSIFSLFYWEYTPKDKNTESLEQDFTNQQAEEDIPTDEEIDTVNETNFIDDFDEFLVLQICKRIHRSLTMIQNELLLQKILLINLIQRLKRSDSNC